MDPWASLQVKASLWRQGVRVCVPFAPCWVTLLGCWALAQDSRSHFRQADLGRPPRSTGQHRPCAAPRSAQAAELWPGPPHCLWLCRAALLPAATPAQPWILPPASICRHMKRQVSATRTNTRDCCHPAVRCRTHRESQYVDW
jgi:hypothetical protein